MLAAGGETISMSSLRILTYWPAVDLWHNLVFLIAMAQNPTVQLRVQEELDTVLAGRLPGIEDRGSLPYCEAVVKEVMRWRPVLPLGAPFLSRLSSIALVLTCIL